MRYYHLSLHSPEKLKPIDHTCASQIGVIIVLSIKTGSNQSLYPSTFIQKILLCDVLIGQELNEITPQGGGGGGTLIFSNIRRLVPFFGV